MCICFSFQLRLQLRLQLRSIRAQARIRCDALLIGSVGHGRRLRSTAAILALMSAIYRRVTGSEAALMRFRSHLKSALRGASASRFVCVRRCLSSRLSGQMILMSIDVAPLSPLAGGRVVGYIDAVERLRHNPVEALGIEPKSDWWV